MSQQLLTTEEAAHYLSVPETFLHRDRWVGAQIPFVRVGKRYIRYRKQDLDHYVESNLMSSTSQYSARASA